MKSLFLLLSLFLLFGCGNSNTTDTQSESPEVSQETSAPSLEFDALPEDTILSDDSTTEEVVSNTTDIIEPQEALSEIIEEEVPEEEIQITPPPITDNTILSKLEADGRFYVFLDLLSEYKVLPLLTEDTQLTVFAPLDEILAPFLDENPFGDKTDTLMPIILLSHITSGRLSINDLLQFNGVEVLSGVPLMLTADNNEIIINESTRIIDTAITGSNGIIHPVDQLILPVLSSIE